MLQVTASDDRKRFRGGIILGVVLILVGLAMGLFMFVAIAAGCGSSRACGGRLGAAWLLPLVVGALPLAGGVATLASASRHIDAEGASAYPVEQPPVDPAPTPPEEPSDP
jgi:hypothetical protein